MSVVQVLAKTMVVKWHVVLIRILMLRCAFSKRIGYIFITGSQLPVFAAKFDGMSTLAQLLAPSRINLDAAATSWQDAVRLAGSLLEQDGHITSQYTQAMIDSVTDNGPYIVVSPGFAFAHARPSEAVTRTSLAFVRLATPVNFGHKSNDPVRLVVALAAQDKDAHLSAMQQLAKIIAHPEKRKILEETTDVQQVHTLFADKHIEHASSASSTSQVAQQPAATTMRATGTDEAAVPSTGKILTVCGNGLGTSLFLKNTLDELLGRWGWAKYLNVEATDTISAKGKAKEADAIFTSAAIAQALGDVGVPVYAIGDFTSTTEIDAALRSVYVID